jgi:inorganic pyrophosphatase
VDIPKGLVFNFEGKEETSLSLNCNYIFSSLDDAKESRIRQLNKMHKLELESIENFFNQFKDEEVS